MIDQIHLGIDDVVQIPNGMDRCLQLTETEARLSPVVAVFEPSLKHLKKLRRLSEGILPLLLLLLQAESSFELVSDDVVHTRGLFEARPTKKGSTTRRTFTSPNVLIRNHGSDTSAAATQEGRRAKRPLSVHVD